MVNQNEKDTKDHARSDMPVEGIEKKQKNEIGGRKGPEPTRYGDWENKGIISDF